MKHYLLVGLLVFVTGLEAADNPFDLKQNLQLLDQSEAFILLELEKPSRTKDKKTATNVKKEAGNTGREVVPDTVAESHGAETELAATKEKNQRIEQSKDEPVTSYEKMLKMTAQDASDNETSKEMNRPVKKQVVLDIQQNKNERMNDGDQTIKGSKLTQEEIKAIYRAALEEAEGE